MSNALKMNCVKNLNFKLFQLVIISLILSTFNSCTYEQGEPSYGGYPNDVGEIIVTKCATAGCHRSQSAEACGGLDLSSWYKMFLGSRANSSVIPYRPEHSFFIYSVNTFPDLGPQLFPTMPYNRPNLTRQEVELLKNWVSNGAPDINGNIKWSNNTARRKVYVLNQGCDFITVFDADTKLVIRTIYVGNTLGTESPHDMIVSPDGQSLYVSFYANSIFQKFNTSDGAKVGEINLPDVSWHTLSVSGNNNYIIASHLDANGKVALIDLNTMTTVVVYQGSSLFVYPHGNALNYNGTLAYITSQQGNFIYKVDITDPFSPDIQQIPLQTGDIPSTSGIYKPYEVEFTPDYSKYYVTCQGTNELRIFNASNDSLLNVISTTGVPQLVSFSNNFPYAFVTCMEDTASVITQSSVNVINTNTNTLIKSITTGYQPRGLTVDDNNKLVWIANRNIYGVGWAPHHTGSCAGRNGYVTIIDMNSLELIQNWETEVSVDPYCVTIRN